MCFIMNLITQNLSTCQPCQHTNPSTLSTCQLINLLYYIPLQSGLSAHAIPFPVCDAAAVAHVRSQRFISKVVELSKSAQTFCDTYTGRGIHSEVPVGPYVEVRT